MLRVSMVALSGVVFAVSLAARQPLAPTPQPLFQVSADDHVGAAACKECHTDIAQAWARTKHARALDKLTAKDREGTTCIGCHITQPNLPHVQCEACHGPGRRHIEAARTGSAGDGPTGKISEATCTRCHNDTSPHYKPFFFSAMKGLVHR